MIVLVTGGRNFNGDVGGLINLNPSLIIHGGARGADSLAEQWAKRHGIHSVRVDALWDFHGKKAGHVRNAAMLLLRPDCCVAFPGGAGTADMVSQCRAAGVQILDGLTGNSL